MKGAGEQRRRADEGDLHLEHRVVELDEDEEQHEGAAEATQHAADCGARAWASSAWLSVAADR